MFDELIKWSREHYANLPWRMNRTLYTTLVSEIMLQQTTVSTVLNHFERFIQKYPTIQSLTEATEEEMLQDWKGLGYYRRCRNLLKASKEILENYKGEIPLDYSQLISINGIGPYTANALLAIGANKPALALDANLERVLSRLYGIKILKGPKLLKEIEKLFQAGKIAKEMKELGPRNYNEALMDLGRSLCKANKVNCVLCPLSSKCVAFLSGKPLKFPIKAEGSAKQKFFELDLLRIIVKKDKNYLAYQKESHEWLSGQYEIPTFILKSEDEKLKQYLPIDLEIDYKLLPSIKTSITKYKITNYVLCLSLEEMNDLGIEGDWSYVQSEKLSTASTKAITLLG